MRIALLVVLAAFVQDPRKQDPAQAHPKVDQRRVDAAIKKGVEFLKTATLKTTKHGNRDIRWDELVLWTFVHAGVPETDPAFERLFKTMMDAELEHTYTVSLQAMILEELDRVKWQWRIQQCAQFLVDNQAENGQWTYGEPTEHVKDIPTGGDGGRGDVATPGGKPNEISGKKEKPRVLRKVAVQKKKVGPKAGDNSNSQYAALGLRACHDAGVKIPNAVLNLGMRWWRDSQKNEKNPKDGYPADGWCYGGRTHGHTAYGSMTAGAIGSLVMYDYMLGDAWKNDKDVLAGLQWLAKNFSVTENPGPCEHGEGKPETWLYYYLYGMERAGVLYGTEVFGGHEWYPTGANWLLDNQKANGSWQAPPAGGANAVWDTCFAILFLRRATRPLEDVATGKVQK